MRTVLCRSALLLLSLSACSPSESVSPPLEEANSTAARTNFIPGSPIYITSDLTPAAFAPQGKIFKLASCNSTAPSAPYQVQLFDGLCYGTVANIRLASYRSKYYLIPADAKFSVDKYGYFCGGGWGWGSGNNAKTPLLDGQTDRACLTHDKGWSAPSGQQPSPLSVMASDKTFLATLKTIKPVWQYETDYVAAAIKWMECRVSNKLQFTNSGKCYVPAVSSLLKASTLR